MREINRLDYNLGLLNSFYRKTYKKIVKKDAPYYYINGNRVISYPREVNQMFSRMICEDAPFMAARFGSVELSAINELYKGKLDKDYRYSKKVMHTLCFNAGFFPEEEKYIEQFGQLMVSDCKYLDVIGLWNDMLEIFTIKTFASNAQGVKLYCFEPYYDIESSWTHALAGKKVLIVHPCKYD